MSNLVSGEVVSAVVTRVASYGVLIEYCNKRGFVDGLELSWDDYGLQEKMEKLYKVGDTLKVKITSVTDGQFYDFYASLKAASPELDPWNQDNKPVVGQKLLGKIVLVTEYGYLVKLPNFVIAVLHNDVCSETLESGQILDVEVSSVDYNEKKVKLIY